MRRMPPERIEHSLRIPEKSSMIGSEKWQLKKYKCSRLSSHLRFKEVDAAAPRSYVGGLGRINHNSCTAAALPREVGEQQPHVARLLPQLTFDP
jgi:hypothetical protein